ncbi:MAG: RecQ family ATP-dependent DNA helicase [Armatimonadota bacterium]
MSLSISNDRLMQLPPRLRLRILNFFLRWHRYDEALPVASRLAEEQADGLLYRSALVKVLAGLGRLEEAEIVASDLIDKYPHRPNALAAAGDLEMAKGDLPAALKYYLEMLKTNAKSPKAWRRLGMLYLAAGQPQKAHFYCRKMLDFYSEKQNGDNDEHQIPPDGLRTLAQVHRQKGDDALAAEIESKLAQREKDEEEKLRMDIEAAPSSSSKNAKSAKSQKLPDPKPFIHPEITREITEPRMERPIPPKPQLPDSAIGCLKAVFGHDQFRSGQEEVVARMLSGQDILAVMPTGAGKSLCYQLPAALGKKVVVISPLIALMKDQIDGLPPELASRAIFVDSSLESHEIKRRLAEIARGKYNLIYAAPERLRQMPFLHALKKCGIGILVVDEVHCISIWGHDFRPDYLFISQALGMIGNLSFCGMTATADTDMRTEIEIRIGKPLVTVNVGVHRPNLVFEVRKTSNSSDKLRSLARFCQEEKGSGIIYTNSRKKTEEIAAYLCDAGMQAGYYHAGMRKEERAYAQDSFMCGHYRVMAATVAFGMGIDKRDVRFVVHYSLPKSLENYYQEAGRAGRDGLPARCILLYSPGDKGRLTTWMKESLIRLQDLKAVYESIKLLSAGGVGLVHDDDLQRESGLDETAVRVAISLLERAGLIKRHMDVPVTVTVNIKSIEKAPEDVIAFVKSARLRVGQRMQLDIRELSARTGIPVYEIEPLLLEWRDGGWLAYSSSGRTMCIERCRVGPGARKLLDEMIESSIDTAKTKIGQLAVYVKHTGCRHGFISQHFGDEPVAGCRSCDNCLQTASKEQLTDDHLLILKAVMDLPVLLNKKGLLNALEGAKGCPIQSHEWPHLGVFRGRSRDAIEQMINELTDWGYLERGGTFIRPYLAMTLSGRKLVVP